MVDFMKRAAKYDPHLESCSWIGGMIFPESASASSMMVSSSFSVSVCVYVALPCISMITPGVLSNSQGPIHIIFLCGLTKTSCGNLCLRNLLIWQFVYIQSGLSLRINDVNILVRVSIQSTSCPSVNLGMNTVSQNSLNVSLFSVSAGSFTAIFFLSVNFI